MAAGTEIKAADFSPPLFRWVTGKDAYRALVTARRPERSTLLPIGWLRESDRNADAYGTNRRSVHYIPMTDQHIEQSTPHKLTPIERAERNLMRQKDAEKAMAEHEKTQAAMYSNMERLRAERLKREAAGPTEPVAKPRRAAKKVAAARA